MTEKLDADHCEFIEDCKKYKHIISGMPAYCDVKKYLDCIDRRKRLSVDNGFIRMKEFVRA